MKKDILDMLSNVVSEETMEKITRKMIPKEFSIHINMTYDEDEDDIKSVIQLQGHPSVILNTMTEVMASIIARYEKAEILKEGFYEHFCERLEEAIKEHVEKLKKE